MGGAKRLLEEDDDKRGIARDIAVKANVLKVCMHHEECFSKGGAQPAEAYKLATINLKNGAYGDLFESRTELTDLIKEEIEENSLDECPRCDNEFSKD